VSARDPIAAGESALKIPLRPIRSSRHPRKALDTLGSALAEFALMLPLLLLLLLGIMWFGLALYAYHFVSGAAREATRFAIVRGSACRNLSGGCPATATDVQNYVRDTAPLGIHASAITVTTTWTPNNRAGSVVNVTVQYNFQFLLPFVPSRTVVMTSSSQMVISR
jgi:Flp pilus assembly protein TadG